MRKAPPPTVPYLGILLSEMSGVVEGMPTYLEDSLINFTKMRKVRKEPASVKLIQYCLCGNSFLH